MSNRKPYGDLAGYKCSRRNVVNRHWVVICEAEAQGLDGDGQRWAVMCMEHSTVTFMPSVAKARPLLKVPDFCEECMKDLEKL